MYYKVALKYIKHHDHNFKIIKIFPIQYNRHCNGTNFYISHQMENIKKCRLHYFTPKSISI